jgi:hypothetical protein
MKESALINSSLQRKKKQSCKIVLHITRLHEFNRKLHIQILKEVCKIQREYLYVLMEQFTDI